MKSPVEVLPIKKGGCPNCHHGLNSEGVCPWCGWPDPKAARKRTKAILKALDAVPEGHRVLEVQRITVSVPKKEEEK